MLTPRPMACCTSDHSMPAEGMLLQCHDGHRGPAQAARRHACDVLIPSCPGPTLSPPGNESHAGQVFTVIGALSLAGALGRVDADLFCWWLAERQTPSGGLNGRPEKLQDVRPEGKQGGAWLGQLVCLPLCTVEHGTVPGFAETVG
jgi:hypothetical protein